MPGGGFLASGRIWPPTKQSSHPPRLCIRADALLLLRARAEEGLPSPGRRRTTGGALPKARPPARRCLRALWHRADSAATAAGSRARVRAPLAAGPERRDSRGPPRARPPTGGPQGRREAPRPRGSSRTAAAAAGARRGCSRRRARRQRRLSLPQTREIQIEVEIEIESGLQFRRNLDIDVKKREFRHGRHCLWVRPFASFFWVVGAPVWIL